MITHLEPDILECEVKWALESITMNKACECDGIPVELFQILKDDAVKVLHSICQQIWRTQQWTQDWKRSVFIPIPKKGNAKKCSNYCTIVLISHASKLMLKILQARLQQYMNCELPGVQAGFRKGRGTRGRIANIYRITVPVSGFSSEAEAWPLRACVSADQLSAGRRLLRAQTLHPAPGGVPHPRRAPL